MNREDTLNAMSFTDDYVEGTSIGLNFMLQHQLTLITTEATLTVADLYRLVKKTVYEYTSDK